MIKRFFLIIPFLTISTFCFSQDLSRSVFASQGDAVVFENWTLDWTLGESFIETASSQNVIYTQGFQQPFLTTRRIDTAETLLKQSLDLVIYPNPVDALLYVHLNSDQGTKLFMSLYDVSGQLIKHSTILGSEGNMTVDVSDLSSGVYLLKFTNTEGSILETHRVIKQ